MLSGPLETVTTLIKLLIKGTASPYTTCTGFYMKPVFLIIESLVIFLEFFLKLNFSH
jgi:hypothetical protein